MRVAPLQLDPSRADQSTYFVRVNAGKRSVALDLGHRRGAGRGAGPGAGRRRARRELHAGRDGASGPRLRGGGRRPAGPRLLLHLGIRPDGPVARPPRVRPRRPRDLGPDAPRAGGRRAAAGLCTSRRPTCSPARTRSAPSRRRSCAAPAPAAARISTSRCWRRSSAPRTSASAACSTTGRRIRGRAAGWWSSQIGDGWVAFQVVGVLDLWPRLVQLLGRPELPADPRFATPVARREHWPELRAIIAEWLTRFTSVEEPAGRSRCGAHPVRAGALAGRGGRGAASPGAQRLPGGRASDARLRPGDRVAVPRRRGADCVRRARRLTDPARTRRTVLAEMLGYEPERIAELARLGAVAGPGLTHAGRRAAPWPAPRSTSRIGAAWRTGCATCISPQDRLEASDGEPDGADARRGQARRRDLRGGRGRHHGDPAGHAGRRRWRTWPRASGRLAGNGHRGPAGDDPRLPHRLVRVGVRHLLRGHAVPPRRADAGGRRAAPATDRVLGHARVDPGARHRARPRLVRLARRGPVDAGGDGGRRPAGPRLREHRSGGRRLPDRMRVQRGGVRRAGDALWRPGHAFPATDGSTLRRGEGPWRFMGT